MAPAVRDIQSLINEQSRAIAPQNQLIDESINQNAQAGQAQEQGLAATQKKAFGQIEQGAQNKGMFFSGFSPDEQANYTSSTYLPALAQLQSTIAKTRSDLLGKKADLSTNVFDKASAMRENDMQTLNAWNRMTAEQKFNSDQADKQRVFEAQQNQAKMAADARNSAANRASSQAGEQVSPQEAALGIITAQGSRGQDGFVSPSTFQIARDYYRQAGGDPRQFAKDFWKYTGAGDGQPNQKRWKSYYNG